MTRRFFVAAFFMLAASGVVLRAEDNGRTAGLTLLRSMAARPSAMGEAYAGVLGDIDAMPINPASLARVSGKTISSTYLRDFAQDNFGFLSYAHPMDIGSLFIGGSYFDAGTIDLNQSDGTQGTVRAQQDVVGMLGFAIGREGPLSAGVTGKFMRSQLAEAATANVYGLDAGAQWKTPLKGLSLGAAVQNLGPNIKYETEGDPMPRTARVGIAYLLDLQDIRGVVYFPYRFLVTVDGTQTDRENAGVRTGLEVTRRISGTELEGSASIRGGYRTDTKSGDAGLGFAIGAFSLDYSIHLINALDPSHHITIAYRFSDKADKPVARRNMLDSTLP